MLGLLKGNVRCIAQRALQFGHNGTTVRGVPDVICFHGEEAPGIVDWKVYAHPLGDSWLQLATYAIALCRCNPHRDWPALPTALSPTDVQLAEVQLLDGSIRVHHVSNDDVEEVEDLIFESATDMLLAMQEKPAARLTPQDFRPAFRPSACQVCHFRSICWEGGP
jgi:hypothetical protein